jgi:HK97 family phage prohead protease
MTDNAPYGDVAYGDPGYQKDGKKRYPIDTADHVRAAWSYINQADNAKLYSSEHLAAIKGRIKGAAKRLGVEIADTQNRAASGVVYIPSVVYTRDSAVAAVNTKQRVIDVLAVPWNKESDDPVPFEEGMYRERFAVGAFDHLEANPGRISVNVGHNRADPIGKVEDLNVRHPAGLMAQLKIAAIPRGDDVLQLAEEGMLSPSIGYYTKPGGYRKSRRAGVVEVRQAWLDHIGLVGVPAYSGAQVIDVRQPGAPTIEVPTATTPFLDEFLNDPVVQWVNARVPRGRE